MPTIVMMTTFLIGVDEAGYGPNLGPLVVAATLWQLEVPEPAPCRLRNGRPSDAVSAFPMDLYAVLADRISRTADENRVAIADSKTLYSPATGLALLEEGVLAALQACNRAPRCWLSLVEELTGEAGGAAQVLPWHQSWNTTLPVSSCPERVGQLAQRLLPTSENSPRKPVGNVSALLRDVQASIVHPADFNRLTDESGTKATALSRISLQLLARMFERLRAARTGENSDQVFALCDKHGGRNYYAPLLVESFSQTLIQVQQESRAISRYRVKLDAIDVEIAFQCEGESFLPTALASMTAKYVRELAMRAFNEFWCQHVADLRPTAGYPGDSRRFKAAIAATQAALGIDDHLLWRRR
jgi:hypothetical protein